MPTGYTCAVQDGTVTEFRDFAMRCARAFGALVTLRDDRIDAEVPAKLEPSTGYYDETIASVTARISELRAFTPSQVAEAALKAHEEAVVAWIERQTRRGTERARFEAMLEKSRRWEPPTEEHTEMKQFMIEQLERSISHDCDGDWDTRPEPIPSETWLADYVASLELRLQMAEKSRSEEIERTDVRNQWLSDLRKSLEPA